LEHSKSLLSEQIFTTYIRSLQALYHCPADSCTSAFPLSSNCRSAAAVCNEDRWEAVYTLCLPLWDDCVHCFSFSHTNAILSWDKNAHVNTKHILKNRPRGATHLHYIIHFYKIHFAMTKTHFAMTKLIHHLYNNNHQVLCPQRILKPPGSFPWHCKKLFPIITNYFTIENIQSSLITFSCTFSVYDSIIF
jgi:hypothetical protein